MLLLLACVHPDGSRVPEEPAESARADETSLASCSVEVTTTVDGVLDETCTATYDAAGRLVHHDCLNVAGHVDQGRSDYDDAGCRVHDFRYLTITDFGLRDERDITCDAHLYSVTEIGASEQYFGDGTLDYASTYEWRFANTYEGDLLVERLHDYGDGRNRRQTTYSYNSDELLEAERYGAEGRPAQAETLHFYDDAGNRVRSEHVSDDYEWTSQWTYDALRRVVSSVSWNNFGDRTSTRVTAWEGDTLREAHEALDEDSDGTFETTLDYSWSCP